MTCIALPPITIPTLPTGFSFAVTLPPLPSLELCCRIVIIPPIPLPPIPAATLNSAFLAAINAATAIAQAYLDSIEVPCPRQ
jgi:hypothetical protein